MLRGLLLAAIVGELALGSSPFEEAWLASDDECAASGDSDIAVCQLSALQLRGAKSSSGSPYWSRDLVADEGHELSAHEGIDPAACERLCDTTTGCSSFAYGHLGTEWGKCYLKDKVVSPFAPASTNSWKKLRFKTYYKIPVVGDYIPRKLVAAEGNQVGQLSEASPKDCVALCDRTPHCHSFTFSLGGDDKNTCYLKDGPITADSPSSEMSWDLDRFLTYYRTTLFHLESEDYQQASRCRPGALITSLAGCRAAAEDLRLSAPEPRVVPQANASLPPGCFVGGPVANMGAGMFFNPFGLKSYTPELQKVVRAVAGFHLLCKRKPYRLRGDNHFCGVGKEVSSLGECVEAAEWLLLGQAKQVEPASVFTSPTGCFHQGGTVWFNGADASFGSVDSAVRHVCRTEALTSGLR